MNQKRLQQVIENFKATFGRHPTFVVRAPGRVNLLGEHTDYNSLPVLPMAIERCVLIAGAPRGDRTVELRNAGMFPPRRYALERHIAPFEPGDWGNYCKAAAQGLTDYYDEALPRGADLLVDGDIPSGAGLSSSSALVVGSALAFLAANDRRIEPQELAELLPVAERYVGTLSGGMDQAICLLARAGHALRIDFSPLRCRPAPLPRHWSIVVCHSLVKAEKSGAAKYGYNTRVLECRLACCLLGRVLADRLPRPPATLGELVRLLPHKPPSSFVGELARAIPDVPLPLEQIASAAGVTPAALCSACAIPPDHQGPFAVLRRARHVLTEAERVDRAEEALHAGDATAFGQLMDASHASCRDDYEISCPELEELVALAKQAGAVGARLTGAGFGGCTVNLVDEASVGTFLDYLDCRFYRQRLLSGPSVETVRFVFTPCAGAEVFPVMFPSPRGQGGS